MLCVSVRESDPHHLVAQLALHELAEVRLDAAAFDESDVELVFGSHPRLIATMRPGTASDTDRARLLVAAVRSGAAYVDVELDAPAVVSEPVVAAALEQGCKIIVSHHDPGGTPGSADLNRLVAACRAAGADIVKIACLVTEPGDNARLLGLYAEHEDLIVIGMGPLGRITRLAAPLLGAPFTYVSAGPQKETAPGQMDIEQVRRLLAELDHVEP